MKIRHHLLLSLLLIISGSEILAQGKPNPHEAQLIEGGLFFLYGPMNTDVYDYKDLSTGKLSVTHTIPPILNMGIEGAIYPLNLISKFLWQPPWWLTYTVFSLGVEGGAAIIFSGSVKFDSKSECEKFAPCGQTTGGEYVHNIYGHNVGRYGIQYKVPVYIFDNGMAIKLRIGFGSYYTHIAPESYSSSMFAGVPQVNLRDTKIYDFYFRTLLTFEIPIANLPFVGYAGIGATYVARTLGFGGSGIETRAGDVYWQIVAGMSY